MNESTPTRFNRIPLVGIFLIFAGFLMLLHRLNVFYLSWGKIVWMCLAVYGAILVVQAFIQKRRGVVFLGSLIFFVSINFLLRHWTVLHWYSEDWVASMSLALGLSFLMLLLYQPRDLGLLVPIVIFVGFGAVYYLWWWDVVDLYDVRHYVRTYWPALLILWGVTIIFRRRT